MSSWTASLVRCPHVNATIDDIVSNMTLRNATLRDVLVDNLESRGGLHRLLAALDSPSGASGSTGSTNELFPYAGTTILFGIISLMSLAAAVCVWWRWHGLRLLVAASDAADHAVRRRTLTPSTNNIHWILYFVSNAVKHVTTVLLLQVHALNDGSSGSSTEASKVITLLQRAFLGCNCFLLALAMNHQRLYRVREHRRQKKVSPQMVRNVHRTNLACGLVFLIFVVADFVASHAVDESSAAASAFYWVYIAAICLLSVPLLVSVVWVICNQAPVQAAHVTKACLLIAVGLHIVVMLPPSLWNDRMWPSWVASDPCPYAGGNMSAFDGVVCANICSVALFVVFCVVEHRRNRLIGQSEHYAALCERLEGGGQETSPPSAAETPRSGMSAKSSELGTIIGLNAEYYDA